ncbi:MAG: hypothetical protein JRI46_07250, partial [Deltaproteobacteria bacterium]|nr:hypothetical protein [Deltaproteobacteria bacterium]
MAFINVWRKKIFREIIIIQVFFSFFCPSLLQAQTPSSPHMIFKPPYNEMGGASEFHADVLIAQSTARANAFTGFMGVYGTGWIGGATSQAGLWFKFYVPKKMYLKVTAKIRYMGGIHGFGIGECSGFVFKWRVNNEKVHEKKMEGGITPGWIAEKTYEIAELSSSMVEVPEAYRTIKAITELMDFLDYFKEVNEFLTVVDQIENSFENVKTEKLSFGFNAKKGWNEIKIYIQGGASGAVTGSAMYAIIAYLESLLIDGLGYPDFIISNCSVTSDRSWQAPKPEVGKLARLEFDIENRGTLESQNSTVKIDIANQRFDRSVPPLKPNERRHYEIDFIFPQERVDVTVHVDPDDQVYEFDHDWGEDLREHYQQMGIPEGSQDVRLEKGGNLLKYRAYGVKSYTPPPPDLAFDGLPISMEIEDGESAQISFKVINKGGTGQYNRRQTAENVAVRVEITSLGWGETKIIPTLKSGETKKLSFNTPPINRPYHLPAASVWVVEVQQVIDPNNKITETNENNNRNTSYIQVNPPRLPQLSLRNLSISPRQTSYVEGQSITIKAEVEYWGSKPIKDVEVGFYYNTGQWAGPPKLEKIAIKKMNFEKRGSKKTSIIWPVHKSPYIYTDIYCIVDPENKIKEADESTDFHNAMIGIQVKERGIPQEQPIAGGATVKGVDLVIGNKDLFLNKKSFIASDYLGAKVHNRGDKNTSFKIRFSASWIKTGPDGKKEAITKILSTKDESIHAGSTKLVRLYYKKLTNKEFMFSKHVKVVVDVYAKEDVDTSNNRAVFRVGNFDIIA